MDLASLAKQFRQPTTEDRAWHEAGHAVTRLALGLRVEFVFVRDDYSPEGGLTGHYREDALALYRADRGRYRRTMRLVKLAGDIVDSRRRVWAGHHIEALLRELGGTDPLHPGPEVEAEFRRWWRETDELVGSHWLAISRLAEAILASPNRELRDLPLEYLAELEKPS
jgi:hypothetical protein